MLILKLGCNLTCLVEKERLEEYNSLLTKQNTERACVQSKILGARNG